METPSEIFCLVIKLHIMLNFISDTGNPFLILDVSFDEFQLEFIPLDEDVLTLELPGFLKDYFLVSSFLLRKGKGCSC